MERYGEVASGAPQQNTCFAPCNTTSCVWAAWSIVKYVLLVDAERPILDGLRLRFRNMQLHIDYVESGQEAIERMEGQVYDVIIIDMRMPRMSGAELLEVVRLHDGSQHRHVS